MAEHTLKLDDTMPQSASVEFKTVTVPDPEHGSTARLAVVAEDSVDAMAVTAYLSHSDAAELQSFLSNIDQKLDAVERENDDARRP